MEDRALTTTPAAVPGAWVLGAGAAAHAAMVAAPGLAGAGPPDVAWLVAAAVGPLLLAVGLLRRSAPALLIGVPAAWALPAHWLAPGATTTGHALVALTAVACYVPAAAWWLAPRPAARAVEWEALDAAPVRSRPDPLPWVAGLLVAGPALGVAVWPVVAERAAQGFPRLPGLALVGLVLLGTLIGLAVATDLFRGRAPLAGSRVRAAVLAGLALALLGLRALVELAA